VGTIDERISGGLLAIFHYGIPVYLTWIIFVDIFTVADRVAQKLFDDDRQAKLALLPLLLTMILYSCFSVWLIAQPMDMRTSGM